MFGIVAPGAHFAQGAESDEHLYHRPCECGLEGEKIVSYVVMSWVKLGRVTHNTYPPRFKQHCRRSAMIAMCED